MSAAEQARTAAAFAAARRRSCARTRRCRSTSTRARSTSTSCWPTCRREAQASAGRRRSEQPRATRWRSRSGGCTPRSRSRCAATATSTPPCRCPRLRRRAAARPRSQRPRAALAWVARGAAARRRRSSARCSAHRRAVREHLAHVDALRAELEADGMTTRLLDGGRGHCRCCGRASTRPRPTAAARPRRRRRRGARRARRRARARRGAPRRRAPEGRDRALEPGLPRLAPARHRRRGPRADDRRAHHRRAHADGLAARRDAHPPAVHAAASSCTRSTAAASASGSSSPTGGCSRSTAAPSSAAACPTSTATSRSASTRACSASWPAASRPASTASRSTRRCASAARNPNPTALTEAVDYCAEQIEAVGDCKVARGEFRQHELWPSSLPLGRDALRHARASTRPPTPPTWSRSSAPQCGSPTGVPFAFADPGRTVELLNPYDPEHANHTMRDLRAEAAPARRWPPTCCSRAAWRSARAAFVIDRAGHYEMLTRLLGRRAADRARRRRLPVRAEPVGRPRPGARLAREGRASCSPCTS